MQHPRRDRPRVAFVHQAARFHYALALAVQKAGMLDSMLTDWYAAPGSAQAWASKLVRLVNKDLGQRMLDRKNPEIDAKKVSRSWTLQLLRDQRNLRWTVEGRWPKLYAFMEKAAQTTLRKGFGDANVVMAFLRDNHPSLFREARARGYLTVGDQIIAPASIEFEELTTQFERFPDWQRKDWFDYLPQLAELERECWGSCDHITCGSEYV
jgi:hypothetical protein